MRTTRFIALSAALAAAIALALACAGTHPKPVYAWDHNANFNVMKSFAWYDDPTFHVPHGDSIIDGAFLDGHIRSAVEDALHHKGYEKVKEGQATMLVAYHTGDTGVGERDEFGDYEWWTGAVVATNWEKERTVTIDIRNKDRKLVWRGQIDRLEGSNPEGVARELNHEVTVLLSHFPPTS
ncbi:MAG TPA: DUF4136 domain-containing protein [Thermoanaerobaculia bacterium]|nr:DUF4136 domain-containing protein [Thermoanaerobaculia bacterium]